MDEPTETPESSPVSEMVATFVLLETQGFKAAGEPEPESWVLPPEQTVFWPVMFGAGLTVTTKLSK